MMKIPAAVLVACAGVILTLFSVAVAQACVPLPPPRWDLVPQEGGQGIAIGRIVSVVPDGGDAFTDFIMAEVETLEILQGEVPPRFSLRGISERRIDPSVVTLWCGRLMTDNPGDVVMALDTGEGRYRLLLDHQITAPYLDRMQSYRLSASSER